MKKSLFKAASILLSVVLIITSLVAVCGISASAENTPTKTNLVSGALPVIYNPVFHNSFDFSFHKVRIDEADNITDGYDLLYNAEHATIKDLINEVIAIPYYTSLTDGKSNTTHIVKPEFSFDVAAGTIGLFVRKREVFGIFRKIT